MNILLSVVRALSVAVLASASVTYAGIVAYTPVGTGNPPASIGGFTLDPFPPPEGSTFQPTTVSESPLGGAVRFNATVNISFTGAGWPPFWRGGYQGGIYSVTTPSRAITLTFPPTTRAFSFYAAGRASGTFSITATGFTNRSRQISVSQDVTTSAGARYFGFATNESGEYITSITVSSNAATFGLSEFRIDQQTFGDLTEARTGTVTARGENSAAGEVAANVFDNILTTKWLDFSSSATGRASFIQYQPIYPYILSGYSVRSAYGAPERAPASWQLLGSNDGTSWVVLDSRTNQTFATGGTRLVYSLATIPPSYTYFRLNITRVANPSTANSVQFSEWELFGRIDD